MTVGGKPAAAPDAPVRWVFSDDGTRTIYKGPDKWSEGKYTADPKRAPMALDLDPEHPAGATYLCVFERDGDTLRVHVGWQGAGRPTGFECPAGSRSTVYVFKRVKKRD
jgi:uncharacterized protein (TIGR03067 family)